MGVGRDCNTLRAGVIDMIECPHGYDACPMCDEKLTVEQKRGWNKAIEAAAKLADMQRNVRVHCGYLPDSIRKLKR